MIHYDEITASFCSTNASLFIAYAIIDLSFIKQSVLLYDIFHLTNLILFFIPYEMVVNSSCEYTRWALFV